MNRRDAAMIAHLDAIEGRLTALIAGGFDSLRADIRQLREDVAGIKLELATHGHDEGQVLGDYWYLLDGRTPRRCTSEEWSAAYPRRRESTGVDPWRVDRTTIGTAEVSTVFLGINHNWMPDGPPLLFETMVFGSGTELDEDAYRTSTWDAAQAMHDHIVANHPTPSVCVWGRWRRRRPTR